MGHMVMIEVTENGNLFQVYLNDILKTGLRNTLCYCHIVYMQVSDDVEDLLNSNKLNFWYSKSCNDNKDKMVNLVKKENYFSFPLAMGHPHLK